MSSCTIIKFKDLNIVYTDISGATPEESIEIFNKNQEIIAKMPPKSVYAIVNAKDSRFNSQLIQKIKETVKANNAYSKATAVCGLSQLSKLMVNSIVSFTGRKIATFDSIEEAKVWLYDKYHRSGKVAV